MFSTCTVEITQYALNQRSPAEGKGKAQKLQKQHALKGQKLLALSGHRPGYNSKQQGAL